MLGLYLMRQDIAPWSPQTGEAGKARREPCGGDATAQPPGMTPHYGLAIGVSLWLTGAAVRIRWLRRGDPDEPHALRIQLRPK